MLENKSKEKTPSLKKNAVFIKGINQISHLGENSLLAIATYQKGHIVYWNKKYEDLFGYSSEEIKAWKKREFYKIIHPDDLKNLFKNFRIADYDAISFRLRGVTKDNKIINLDNYNIIIEYNGAKAYISTYIEIENLRDKSSHFHLASFRRFLDTFPIGIVFLSENRQIKYINQEFLNIIGYSMEEFLNLSYEDFFKIMHPEDSKRVYEITKKLMNDLNEGYITQKTRFRILNGKTNQYILIETYSKPIFDEGKKCRFVVVKEITLLDAFKQYGFFFDDKYLKLKLIYNLLNKDFDKELYKLNRNLIEDTMDEIKSLL